MIYAGAPVLILVLLRRCVYPFFFLFGLELAGQEMLKTSIGHKTV